MDFSFSEEQTLLRDSVGKLMDKHAPPELIRRLDREQALHHPIQVLGGLLAEDLNEIRRDLGGHERALVLSR